MNIGSFLISDTQSTELIEPSERPFHHPAPSTELASVLSVALGDPRHNAAGTKTLADRIGVIAPIAQ
jgi:hypothetical protein